MPALGWVNHARPAEPQEPHVVQEGPLMTPALSEIALLTAARAELITVINIAVSAAAMHKVALQELAPQVKPIVQAGPPQPIPAAQEPRSLAKPRLGNKRGHTYFKTSRQNRCDPFFTFSRSLLQVLLNALINGGIFNPS